MSHLEIFKEDGTYIFMNEGEIVGEGQWVTCDECKQPSIKKNGKFYDYPDGSWSFVGGCCK